MADSIVLSSSIRANLLSLQNTTSLMDKTQFNLSTGKKVNSALDNAVSFFTAKGLTDRASDLNTLLDAMGQSVSSLKQADTGVTNLTKMVDQAKAIAGQANDALAKGAQEAKVTGDRDLRSVTDLTTLQGVASGAKLTFNVVDKNGNDIDTVASSTTMQAFTGKSIAIATGDTIDKLVANINALDDSAAKPVLEAKLNDKGQLEIKALNGARVSITFDNNGNGAGETTTTNDANMAASLGFGTVADSVADGGNTSTKKTMVTLASSASLTSNAFYKSGSVAKASDLLTDLFTDALSTASKKLIDPETTVSATDKLVVGVNNASSKSYSIENLSVEGLITKINGDFKGQLEASFDETSGQINIRATAANVSTVQFGVHNEALTSTATDDYLKARFGFGVQSELTAIADNDNASTPAPVNADSVESIRLGSAASDLATFESEYNKIRDQIDSLVKDAGYRGTNLLNGDSLLTVFNEDRSTSITTKGQVLSSAGLGLEAANFGSAATVDASLTQVREATNALRTFSSSLANDLTVIQTRQDFTKQTVNTLQEGSDKLTVADPNEEGARMLALQTRQQLAVSALSLASQAQQSVLSLLR